MSASAMNSKKGGNNQEALKDGKALVLNLCSEHSGRGEEARR